MDDSQDAGDRVDRPPSQAQQDDDRAPKPAPRTAGEPGEGRAIRAWSRALNAGDFDRAASFFADGAIVEQVQEVRLPDRRAAVAFNRSLPCRARVTEVERDGREVIAEFDLRRGRGPASSCGGSARVRFRFREGKFSEWRQVVQRPGPKGQAA